MSAQTISAAAVSARVDWAPVPKVNLLPPEILEGRQFARRQKLLGCAVVAAVAAAGAGVFYAQGQVSNAQDELALEQGRTTTLQTEKAKYDAVPLVLAQVDAAKTARGVAMATDVPWYRFLNDLALSTPRNVWLENVTVTVPVATATTGTTGTDALAAAGIGTVTVTGKANDFPTVASWLEGLDQVSGVDGTAISQAQADADAGAAAADADHPLVGFTSAGSITPEALSHLYDRKAD
jgi:Tfp pilus assembly protein PilN